MTEQEQQMMQQQMMQQQGQQAAPSQEEQMMMMQQQQQQQQQQAPQQGAQEDAMQKIMQFVQEAISQGMEPLEVAQLLMSKQVPPEIIMQVFVQVGLPEADAQTVIQQAMAVGQAEAGAEQPMQEGQPMPPEGQPMPPEGQPPMGRGGMMYAEEGMAVNNEELNVVMQQVQEMLNQPNVDIQAVMLQIQTAAENGQISPETATTVLQTLQQSAPTQNMLSQPMSSEDQMMQEQGQAGLARFGGNLRKLLKKAYGGSMSEPDETSENYGMERTNGFLNAVKNNFYTASLDDATSQFPSLNKKTYAYGGELMADTNMYDDGGELCPPCPDGSVVERLPDGNCPCSAQQVPNTVLTPATQTTQQQTNTDAGMQAIDQALLNPGSGNTVLTPGATSNNTHLENLLKHQLNGDLTYGDFKANGNIDFVSHAAGLNLGYKPKTGFNFDLGTSVDKKGATKRNLGLGYNFVNPFGIAKSKLGLNTYMNYSNPKGIIGAVAPADNPTLYDPKTVVGIKGEWVNGNWVAKADLNSGTGLTAGLDYNFKPGKDDTGPAVKLGVQYQNNLGLGTPTPTTTPGPGPGPGPGPATGLALGGRALVQAGDGIFMKDNKVVVDFEQFKDADAYELAYRRWNADPKNAKFLIDPKKIPYKKFTPYVFTDKDDAIKLDNGKPVINQAKFKTREEYIAAAFDWNKKFPSTPIDLNTLKDFIPVPVEKPKPGEVVGNPNSSYKWDEKTKTFIEDKGEPVFGLSKEDWELLPETTRTSLNEQAKRLEEISKKQAGTTTSEIQPVNYNQPAAAFQNPWARVLSNLFTNTSSNDPTVAGNNLPPGFDLNSDLKEGMRGVTVDKAGKEYAWRVTSTERFKKRVPGLFNNEKGLRLNIEWGDADDEGNIIEKDNGNNKITPEKVEVVQDPKDKTNNVVVLDPKNGKKNNGTGLYQSQNMEIFDANGNVIIPGINTASTGNQTVTSTIPAANSFDPRFEDERKITYIDGDAGKIINEAVNGAANYNQNIPNNFYRQTAPGRGVDNKGRLITDPNYIAASVPSRNAQDDPYPMYELNRLTDSFRTANTKIDQAQGANDMINSYIPYSEDPNIPIGYAEMPYAFDNTQPSQQAIIDMQNKIKNRSFAQGGNVYALGGEVDLTDEELAVLQQAGFYFEAT
jgi:hypothetical protein